jgi:hypothetical protein
MLLFLAFLFAVPATVEVRGVIYVRVEPGITIQLDGQQVGQSNTRDGGLWIRSVRPGKHRLTFLIPTGGSAEAEAVVVGGQTVTVSVSALALRASTRRQRSDVEVRVESDAYKCIVDFADRNEIITSPRSVVLQNVTTGSQKVSVDCGGEKLSKTFVIPAGRVVTLEANFRTKSFAMVQDKTRVKDLVVKSTRDLLVEAEIPPDAKRLLLSAIRPGLELLSVSDRGSTFAVRFQSADAWPIDEVASALRRLRAVKKVETFTIEKNEDLNRGWVRMELVITFVYGPPK